MSTNLPVNRSSDCQRFRLLQKGHGFSLPGLFCRSFFIFPLLLTAELLPGAERPDPDDPLSSVQIMEGILNIDPERYKLEIIADFEQPFLFRAIAPSTDLSILRPVKRTPANTNNTENAEIEAYAAELAMINNHGGPIESEHSLMIHTAFSHPGRQIYRAEISHPVSITGIPFHASLWVHSNQYRSTLSLLFADARGNIHETDPVQLDWNGWKRVVWNQVLPARGGEGGLLTNTRYGAHFHGLIIRSSHHESERNIALMLNNLLVISDSRNLLYPGAEIQDDWD